MDGLMNNISSYRCPVLRLIFVGVIIYCICRAIKYFKIGIIEETVNYIVGGFVALIVCIFIPSILNLFQ